MIVCGREGYGGCSWEFEGLYVKTVPCVGEYATDQSKGWSCLTIYFVYLMSIISFSNIVNSLNIVCAFIIFYRVVD